MSQSIGATTNQGFEILGAVMAKKQQNQQAQMTTQLVQSAMQTSEKIQASAPVGNLGQNINITV